MLSVKTPEEVIEVINKNFENLNRIETVGLLDSLGKVLAEDIVCQEFIPNFTRSTVDGYAVISKDCFGCSESIPAILPVTEEIEMGMMPTKTLDKDTCMKIPTGGALPESSDSVVMLEYTEDYGDGSVGIMKPVAPAENVIFKGDDKKPGDTLLAKGCKIGSKEIGALAAMGIRTIKVAKPLTIGIISTGNELIPSSETPKSGKIRNVNSDLLAAIALENGCKYIDYGIIKDEEKLLLNTVEKALEECDMVLLSGGSSAGEKDYAARVISEKGEILFHGIAMKPGKPTILGKALGKPIFGLPGHPVASYFVSKLFVCYAIKVLRGETKKLIHANAILTESIESNHGRAQYGGVFLENKNGKLFASPVHSKSGLITTLAMTDGYYQIDSECEGIAKGDEIEVFIYEG